jgi:hypothetical protein
LAQSGSGKLTPGENASDPLGQPALLWFGQAFQGVHHAEANQQHSDRRDHYGFSRNRNRTLQRDRAENAVPRPQDNLAMGEDQVRQLLLLMPTDKKGMVSRQEYMKFMEAEFDRLDKEKKGELDARKLAQSSLTASRFVGK